MRDVLWFYKRRVIVIVKDGSHHGSGVKGAVSVAERVVKRHFEPPVLVLLVVLAIAGEVRLRGDGDRVAGLLLGRLLVDDVLDLGVPAEGEALLGEELWSDPLSECLKDLVDAFVFLDEFLVLAATLYGVPGVDEAGHLLEDLESPAWSLDYLRCNLLDMMSLL